MFKKILPVLIAISFLAVLVVPIFVSADPIVPEGCQMKKDVGITACPAAGTSCVYATNGACGICCTLNTVYTVIDWIFVFLIAVSGIMIMLGAWNYLSSAGEPEKTKKGREYIMYAAIGLMVAFLSRAIPTLVRYIIT